MIKLIDILKEITQFSNWKIPSLSQLKQEFKVEQILKNRHYWNSEEDFLEAVKNGKVVTITPEEDQNIGYRSHTESYDELLDLIKSYRSYPEYRNEETLKAIYDGFKNNQPMDLPIVIELSNGRKRIFSGNTRMDIAFQLGINPKVLLVKS
jgi:DNA-binding transcriptional regulator YhcF (GntR family)